MTMSEQALRDSRHALGLGNGLDDFLNRQHTLPEREVMAKRAQMPVVQFDNLLAACSGQDARDVLHARLTLNLQMAGAGVDWTKR